jgi:hypothetical protein
VAGLVQQREAAAVKRSEEVEMLKTTAAQAATDAAQR